MAGKYQGIITYDTEIYTEIGERVAQYIDVFNSQSAGTIMLRTDMVKGDYISASFFAGFEAAQYRRDITETGAGNVSAVDLTQSEKVSVKVAGGLGPVSIPVAVLEWANQDPAVAIDFVAQKTVDYMIKDLLNTGVAATVAAMANNAGVLNDISAGVDAFVTQSVINDTLAKFGDRSQEIRALVMNGVTYHKLIGDAIDSNAANDINSIAIRDGSAFGQGRLIVVTDSPALITGGFNRVIGLTQGGLELIQSNLSTNIDKPNGNENLKETFQANYDFTVGIKGYAWNKSVGGSSPTDAELATGTNWPQVATSDKDTAGVLLVAD